jgi:quercetin dioxygenase-like cupin family protein
MRAIRLLHDTNGNSYFETGTLPEYHKINAEYFNIQTKVEPYQQVQHTAPRYQFVVTLKGKLQFTTSDGKQFILEPGIILIAKDTEGKGHSWKILEGEKWERIYIVPIKNALDHFVID